MDRKQQRRKLAAGFCSALMSGSLNTRSEGESRYQREMEEKLEIVDIVQSSPPLPKDRVVGKGCKKQKDEGRR